MSYCNSNHHTTSYTTERNKPRLHNSVHLSKWLLRQLVVVVVTWQVLCNQHSFTYYQSLLHTHTHDSCHNLFSYPKERIFYRCKLTLLTSMIVYSNIWPVWWSVFVINMPHKCVCFDRHKHITYKYNNKSRVYRENKVREREWFLFSSFFLLSSGNCFFAFFLSLSLCVCLLKFYIHSLIQQLCACFKHGVCVRVSIRLHNKTILQNCFCLLVRPKTTTTATTTRKTKTPLQWLFCCSLS